MKSNDLTLIIGFLLITISTTEYVKVLDLLNVEGEIYKYLDYLIYFLKLLQVISVTLYLNS